MYVHSYNFVESRPILIRERSFGVNYGLKIMILCDFSVSGLGGVCVYMDAGTAVLYRL